MKYMDSSAFGTENFEMFLQHELTNEGVLNLRGLKGTDRSAAEKANQVCAASEPWRDTSMSKRGC